MQGTCFALVLFAGNAGAAFAQDKYPLLLEEAGKLPVLITPKSGAEIETLMERASATPKFVLDRTVQLLKWKD
jgi:hypothetical protein